MLQQKVDLGFLDEAPPSVDLGFLEPPKAPAAMPGKDMYKEMASQRTPAQKAAAYTREGVLGTVEGLGMDPAKPLSSLLSGIWNLGKTVVKAGLGNAEAQMDLARPSAEQLKQSSEYLKGSRGLPGQTPTESVIHHAQSLVGAGAHAAAAAVPLVGPAAADIGSGIRRAIEEENPEDVARGVGRGVGLIGGLAAGTPEGEALIAKGLKIPGEVMRSAASKAKDWTLGVPPTAIEGTMRAIKPKARNTEFKQNIPTVLQHLQDSLPDLGRPLSEDPNQLFQDAIDLTKIAKKKLWEQRAAHVDPAMAGATVDASPVANSILQSIPTKTWIKKPQLAEAMADEANVYRQHHSLIDLEDMLHTTNAELDSYYDKYPTARRAAAAKNPDTAGLVAEGAALRKLIYDHVDPQGQAGPAAEASRRYGKLLNFEEELYRRKNVFERQQPNSLQEQMGKLAIAKELGAAGAKIGAGLLTGSPEGAAVGAGFAAKNLTSAWAMKKMSTFLKERGSAANMLRDAITDQGVGKPAPLSAPFSPYAARIMNPSRILPPASFIAAPPASEATMGLRDLNVTTAARDVVRDPVTGQMKRVYTSESGEPLASGSFDLKRYLKDKMGDQRGAVSLNGIRPLVPEGQVAQFSSIGEGPKLHDTRAARSAESRTRISDAEPVPDEPVKIPSDPGLFELRGGKLRRLTDKIDLKDLGSSPKKKSNNPFIGGYGEKGAIRLGDFGGGKFFSKAAETIDEKAPSSATADHFLNIAEKAGGQETVGLKDWLRSLGKQKVSKDEVLANLSEDIPQVKDHWIGKEGFNEEKRWGELQDLGTENPDFKKYLKESGTRWSRLSDDEQREIFGDFVDETVNRELRESTTSSSPLGFEDWLAEHTNHSIVEYDKMTPRQRGILDNSYDDYVQDHAEEQQANKQSTKFESYTLPGGTNYREYVATLPNNTKEITGPKGVQTFDTSKYNVPSGHAFGNPELDQNRLFHARVKDRAMADGGKSLFLEELQSDWHQEGRKKGYKSDMETWKQAYDKYLKEANQAHLKSGLTNFSDFISTLEGKKYHEELMKMRDSQSKGVPDAPFKKDWHELGMKRMLQEAADKDYDSLSWTTGKQQADRYSLSKHVDEIVWDPSNNSFYAYKNNKTVVGKSEVTADQLPDLIGKEAAEKLMSSKPIAFGNDVSGPKAAHVLKGQDLDIGGVGMKGFYDQIIPRFMDKYLKKYGVRAEKTHLEQMATDKNGVYLETLANGDIRLNRSLGMYEINTPGGYTDGYTYLTKEAAKEAKEGYKKQAAVKKTGPEVWSVKITPKMREDMRSMGQPIQ